MGRPFLDELSELQSTVNRFRYIDADRLKSFISNNISRPIIAVGSGGSFSVAAAFEKLITSTGGICKAVTPTDLTAESGISLCACILFTAGGNNTDICNVYKFLRLSEPADLLVVCLSSKGKIVKLCAEYSAEDCLVLTGLSKKDGFLSVNSLIAFLTVFQSIHNDLQQSDFTWSPIKQDSFPKELHNKKYVVALYSAYLAPIGIDFESKCSEAGLAAVQTTSLRNFMHGRHNWISKHYDDTAVVAFMEKSHVRSAQKMLDSLPPVASQIVASNYDGFSSIIDVFPTMLEMVWQQGKFRSIDPGRPSVASYGSKLYSSSQSFISSNKTLRKKTRNPELAAISRKIACNPSNRSLARAYEDGYKTFKNRLESTTFDSIVLDYDSTVIENNNCKDNKYREILDKIVDMAACGVHIAFATGRGNSIITQLQQHVPERYWDRIILGCYNGAVIFRLNETDALSEYKSDESASIGEKRFAKVIDILQEMNIPKDPCYSVRRTQVSVLTNGEHALECKKAKRLISAYIQRSTLECLDEASDSAGKNPKRPSPENIGYRILESDHSYDVVGNEVSKLNVVRFLYGEGARNALRIGDMGNEGGGDYELLNSPFGLSVNKVSSSPFNCWRISRPGIANSKATRQYFDLVSLCKDGTFTIKADWRSANES